MAAKKPTAWDRALFCVNLLGALCLTALVLLTGTAWERAIAMRGAAPAPGPAAQANHGSGGTKNNTAQDQATPDKAADQDNFKQRADALQKQVQSEEETFRQRADDQQRLISALTALTGIYTLVVGAASFLSLQQIRDKAKQEITSVQDNLATLRTDVQRDLDALRDEVRRDVPALHSLQARLVSLAYALEAKLPSEKNWNSSNSYITLPENARQEILMAEATIEALSVFGLDQLAGNREVVTDLYLSLARFFSTRAKTATPRALQDIERAYIYLDRAAAVNPESAIAYRMRAVYKISDADDARELSEKAANLPVPDTAERDRQLAQYTSLLNEAERLLQKSRACNEYDAGSYYNFAQLYSRRGDIARCTDELNQLIAIEDKLPQVQRGKYLPSAFINLACYTMRDSAAVAATDPQKAEALESRALSLLSKGRDKAKTYLALDTFRAELEPETLAPKGELQVLMDKYRARMTELLK